MLLVAVAALLGCSAQHDTEPKVVLSELRTGESVYVCGCPMMCCNVVSRGPGRCTCNVPLKRGAVSRIRNGKIYVSVSGREKVFSLPKDN